MSPALHPLRRRVPDFPLSELAGLIMLVYVLLLSGCVSSGGAGAGGSASPAEEIPLFPWPPPAASALAQIPDSFLTRTVGQTRLQDVATRLEMAFDSAGYGAASFYAVPGGFAMASRLEQINSTGEPRHDARFSVDVQPRRIFSLSDYIEALFSANPGRYRVIVFVVTSQPIRQDTAADVSLETALTWVRGGLSRLPAEIGQQSYTDSYRTAALVYEFVRPSAQARPFIQNPSSLLGEDHLVRAGIWRALRR